MSAVAAGWGPGLQQGRTWMLHVAHEWGGLPLAALIDPWGPALLPCGDAQVPRLWALERRSEYSFRIWG